GPEIARGGARRRRLRLLSEGRRAVVAGAVHATVAAQDQEPARHVLLVVGLVPAEPDPARRREGRARMVQPDRRGSSHQLPQGEVLGQGATAAKDGGRAYMAGVLLAIDEDNTVYVEDVVRGAMELRRAKPGMKLTAQLDPVR